nr:SIR2 family protein [Candidatus Freyarchaeota archaeon]
MMGKLNLTTLAYAIATRRCALFAGAGLTCESGGATWNQLVDFLKSKFGYDSPLTDNFRIMGDMCNIFGPEVIYEAVKNRLEDARIDNPISKLTGLPWFTTFTTNYDLALEKSLQENQSLNIRTIATGKEFALTGLPYEMLCVKLMGSLDIPYDQPGSMVLDPGDYVTAIEERSRIFDILASHAANLSFLFIGYSFNDGLFLEILDKLIKAIGKPKLTYYAVFKEKPDPEKSYLLKQYGVEIIVSDLKNFAKELSEQVALRNPGDLRRKRIPLGSDVLPIDSTKVPSFLSFYTPVLYENLEEPISPNSFFKGNTDSFHPFGLNWHFQRKEIKEVVKTVLEKKGGENNSRIISVEGNPGTGRTFVILAAVYELIKNHRAIAIKIPSYALNPIPSTEELVAFLDEVEKAAKEAGISSPEQIVFWAEFAPETGCISQFNKLSSDSDYPIALIFEDTKSAETDENLLRKDERTSIDVDVDLSEEEKENLAEYILNITRTHKFPEITEEETHMIINEEKTFLPIMYRALDPARRSIEKIVQEEFSRIDDQAVKTCISLCSLATSVDIYMPMSVLKKALSKHMRKQLSFQDIFEIIENKAKAFIKLSIDPRTNYLCSIYHSLIAQYLLQLIGINKADEYLLRIAETVDIRGRIEAEFIAKLLIDKGVNCRPGIFKPFTGKGLEDALLEIKNRQPARPIIHHLARLIYTRKDRFDENIIPLLHEALAEPEDSYALEERKENVMTTLALVMWSQKKDRLLDRPIKDPEIQEILSLLIKARETVNLHPYLVHAKILKDLSDSNDDHSVKTALINEALEVVDEGLSAGLDYADYCQQLKEFQIELLSEIDPKKAEDTAKELLESEKDGAGYYTLARIEYHKNQNYTIANLFLDKAIEAKRYPPGAIALKIEILLQDSSPDYGLLLKLVDRLSSDARFHDSWRSAYHKAVVYTINGRYQDAANYFRVSFRMAPRTLPIQKMVQLFWMGEDGHREVLTGKVDITLTEREGRIYSHNVQGWKEKIYFDPRSQKNRRILQPGLYVDFELGFSPRGPIAFEVRPSKKGRK